MANPSSFVEYVSSVISLDALESMTTAMDRDIQESQKLMDEIKSVFEALPAQSRVPTNSGSHADFMNFVDSDVPRLLLPDMSETMETVDLDDAVATMKGYIEDLKENYEAPETTITPPKKEMQDLDLDQYAFSLDQLGKRLANIKLSKREEVKRRNPELENKLTQLCEDVNNFTQMIQAKTRLTEINKNWSETQQEPQFLQYHEMITKLFSGINEVTYLLQKKN